MKIDHAALYAQNLELMKQFYIEFFNAESGQKYVNKNTGFESYFLYFESGARLEIMHRPDVKGCPGHGGNEYIGISHLAFSVGSKALVDETTKKLGDKGFQVISGPRTTGDGYYESCVLDPDGNRVEITE